MTDLGRAALSSALQRLRVSHEYADLKIHCGEETFPAHKAIVCTRSSFFQTACSWGQNDKPKDEIDLGDDDDPRLFKLMLDYLYLMDYDDSIPITLSLRASEATSVSNDEMSRTFTTGSIPLGDGPRFAFSTTTPQTMYFGPFGQGDRNVLAGKSRKNQGFITTMSEPNLKLTNEHVQLERLIVNVSMYTLGDKYGIDDLKLRAKDKFVALAGSQWDTKAFVEASEMIFNSTVNSDESLRDVVFELLAKHRELIKYPEWAKLLKSGNGLAWRLLQSTWN